jgi:hypothetical protein
MLHRQELITIRMIRLILFNGLTFMPRPMPPMMLYTSMKEVKFYI